MAFFPKEWIVTNLLNGVASDYIEHLDPTKLEFEGYKGILTVRDVRLKRTALDKLQLPIAVTEGSTIKLLRITFPFFQDFYLAEKSVIIEVH